jgi:hypothetical protein
MRQSVIRNSIYAAIWPLFLLIGLFSIASAGAIFAAAYLLSLLAKVNGVSFFGYDPDNGRTIPDSWAETHVLPPSEIAAMLRMKRDLESISVIEN